MTDVERRALDAIDLPALNETLVELIAFPSLGGQESPAQQHVAGTMEKLGLEVDRWPIDMDRMRRHPAYTAEIPRHHALGVVGRFGNGEPGKTLVLNGHIDVVPAGEPALWTISPWDATVRDGRVYGRGSADMKGGLCCALYAAHAIRRAGVKLRGAVVVQSVVGEEDGGVGTLAALDRGHTGDAAIVLEPTEMIVAPAQAGALNFRLTVPGQAAHGALRTEGISPFDKYLPLYSAMRECERRRNQNVTNPLFADYELPFALCIGKVSSGIWGSTEAESLTCEGRLGISPEENPADVRRTFERIVHDAGQRDPWLRDHPPLLEWWGAQFEPASIDPDHEIVSTLGGAHCAVTGQPPVVRGMPYGADMRLLVNEARIPTVLYGPGDIRRAHAPDEFVPVSDLVTVTRALVLTIVRFCGVA